MTGLTLSLAVEPHEMDSNHESQANDLNYDGSREDDSSTSNSKDQEMSSDDRSQADDLNHDEQRVDENPADIPKIRR